MLIVEAGERGQWVGSATRIGGVEAICLPFKYLSELGLLLREKRVIAAMTPIPMTPIPLRSGPVNWTPRFDSEWLQGSAGLANFLRYIELNPVRAKLCKKPERWAWSSAAAHLAGTDEDGLLCLDRWRELFGAPAKIEEVWREYLNGPIVEEKTNALRIRTWSGSVHNRPRGWVAPESTMSAGSSPEPRSAIGRNAWHHRSAIGLSQPALSPPPPSTDLPVVPRPAGPTRPRSVAATAPSPPLAALIAPSGSGPRLSCPAPLRPVVLQSDIFSS